MSAIICHFAIDRIANVMITKNRLNIESAPRLRCHCRSFKIFQRAVYPLTLLLVNEQLRNWSTNIVVFFSSLLVHVDAKQSSWSITWLWGFDAAVDHSGYSSCGLAPHQIDIDRHFCTRSMNIVVFFFLKFASTPNNRPYKLTSRLRCHCRSFGIFNRLYTHSLTLLLVDWSTTRIIIVSFFFSCSRRRQIIVLIDFEASTPPSIIQDIQVAVLLIIK